MTTVTGPTIVAGRVLGGRYELEQLLARGGMAEVWEGHDATLSRPVAVKILQHHLATDASFVERFRREAVTAARLGHHCIVATYDAGIDAGTAYIVMELIRGRTLRQLLTATGPLDPALAVAIALQIADALAYAHRSGLVHRDVKPANVLLCDEESGVPRVKVTDFGIAKTTLDVGPDLTVTGTVLGTPKYFSPEQVEGRIEPDARSDLYALGVVLFEMLTGRVPFDGPTEMATALAHLRDKPPSVTALRPAVPKAVDAIVQQLLAKSPADRPPTAVAARQALELLGRDLAAGPGRGQSKSAVRWPSRSNGTGGPNPAGPAHAGNPTDHGGSRRQGQARSDPMQAPALNGPVGAGGWTPPRPQADAWPVAAAPRPGPPATSRTATSHSRLEGTAAPSRSPTSPSTPPAAGRGPDLPGFPTGSPSRVTQSRSLPTPVAHPVPSPPPRRKRRDGRVVGVVVALLVVAALAVTSVLVFGGGTHGKGGSPGTVVPTTPVKVDQVEVWMNNFRSPDNPGLTHFTIDGNPATAWDTETYNCPANLHPDTFCGLYSGEGLAIELHGRDKVVSLTVTSPTKRWAASTYVSATLPATGAPVSSWGQPTASRQGIDGDATFSLGGRRGRWVLLWLTNIGPLGQASIAEITVT